MKKISFRCSVTNTPRIRCSFVRNLIFVDFMHLENLAQLPTREMFKLCRITGGNFTKWYNE